MSRSLARARMAAFWTWIGATACAAALVFGPMGARQPQDAALVLGLLFAAYAMTAYWVAGRLRTLAAAVLVGWGTAFGFWFPVWHERAGEHAAGWLAALGLGGSGLESPAQWFLAAAAPGWATALVLLIATGSARVATQTLLLSAVAGLAAVVPWSEARPGAVVLWHAGVAASLCRAAVDSVRAAPTRRCPRCGEPSTTLAGRACRGCGQTAGPRRPLAAV